MVVLSLLLTLSLWILVVPCWAQRTVTAEKPITVKLEVGQPTSLAFPEVIDSVQWMRFGDKEAAQRLDVTSRGPYCYLLLLDETYSGRMFVLGQSGKQYLVSFSVGTPADVMVHILPQKPPAQAGTQRPQPLSVSSVLRALWMQTPLPGQQPVDIILPALPDSRLAFVGSQARTIGRWLGLIIQVRNTSAVPVALDVRVGLDGVQTEGVISLAAWVWPPRLTVHALATDHDTLDPGMEARILVVLERREP